MNKLQIKCLLAICLLPILLPIQFFSQNHFSNHLISNGEEKQSSSAFSILVKEEFNARECKVEFSAKGGSASSGNTCSLSSGIYLYQLKVYFVDNEGGKFIQTKKKILPMKSEINRQNSVVSRVCFELNIKFNHL